MKRILKKVLLILLLLGEFSYSQSGASMQVKCDGSIDGTIGSEFTISIDVNNVTNFLGASFNLTYNSTYLDYVTATAGSWIGNSSDLIFFPAADEVTGIVSVGITRKGTIGAINGTGNIVSIKFRVTSLPGQTTTLPFTLSAVNAIDPNGGSIPLAQINDSTQLIIQGDYILTITSANGTVTKNPDQVSYTSGSAVILTATPNQGYMFSGWGGDANGTINPLTVTMDGNKNIIANFTIIPILPTINVSNALINFGEVSINTISAEKSYNVTGINLAATVVISAPNGFQISRSSNQGFTTSLILAPNAGVVNETIFVRFLPNETKNYNASIENISTGATAQNVEVRGTGILPPRPTVNVNNTSLIFGDVLVNTNSSPKSYILSGSNLSSNITIEAPSSFQISNNETFGFGSSITLNPTNGTVSNTLIWVRFSPAAAQSYSGNVINTSSGAITKNVSVSGTGGNKVTTSSNPDNGGTTSGGGIYNTGKNIAVKATSNKGFKFINWTENAFPVSTDSSYQFTMPNNSRALVANFSDGKGNRSPIFLKSMPDTTIYVHNVQVLFKYEYKAVDPDGDVVNFKLDSGPDGATLSNMGLFIWIPKTTQAGMQYLLKISISDGTLTQTIITTIKTFSTIVGIEEYGFIFPSKFDLKQNYPNPFNPMTKINYQLARDGLVTLIIYDLLGREVVELINEFKTAGYYKVDFDASILSSGVYICSIKANDFSKSIKLILTK